MEILNHKEEDLIRQKASITAAEIANQPQVWHKLAGVMRENREAYSAFMTKVLGSGKMRIIFTGAGSSAFIGESMSMMLAGELGIRSEVFHTTEIIATPDEILYDTPTLLVSYSRSGSSPESCAAIQVAQEKIHDLYNLVFVCNRDSILAKVKADPEKTLIVNIPQEASDQGFAMTCSVSCMSLATWSLFSGKDMDRRIGYIDKLADAIAGELSGVQKIAAEVVKWDYNRIVYLGFGALRGLAREGAVKSQELSDGYVVALYDTPTGFRHGPKTVLNDRTLTVFFASPKKLAALYDKDMINELATQEEKNRLAVLTDRRSGHDLTKADYKYEYEVPAEYAGSEINAYIYDLMFLQILSFEKSLSLGITTDNPCPDGSVNRVVTGIIIH